MAKSPIPEIIAYYQKRFIEKNGAKPVINGGWCGKLLKERLKDHSKEGIIRIIELYFDDPANADKVDHLPTIMSAWNYNKYLPKMKYDPNIYADAEELNKNLR